MSRSFHRVIVIAFVLPLAAGTALAACSSPPPSKPGIVAATNVWGSVATAVAGPDVSVRSIITDPTADPHSYQTTPSDAAAIRTAELVIVNGGDYDEFAEKAAAGRKNGTINAFDLRTGAARNDDNEHIWYDLATVGAVATRIAGELSGIDPAHAAAYTHRAEDFRAALQQAQATTAAIAAAHPKAPVIQTEPLGHYLLVAANVEDRTPHAFEEAIEHGTDPVPADLATVQNLVRSKKVRAVVENVQTEDKTTRELVTLARTAGVPVVQFTETLPPNTDYLRWQNSNIQALAAALN